MLKDLSSIIVTVTIAPNTKYRQVKEAIAYVEIDLQTNIDIAVATAHIAIIKPKAKLKKFREACGSVNDE